MAFLIYTYLTLFFGNSIATFIGLSVEQENFFLSIHYRSLPFLLIAYITSKFPRFNKQELLLIGTCFLTVIIAYVFVGRSAMFAVSMNNAIEPVLLIATLRWFNGKHRNSIKSALLLFFLFECVVAWFEVITRTFLFADPTIMMADYRVTYMLSSEMRAFSLHGHPLQNAFIVSILSFFYLTAKGKPIFRYGLFTIGYITLFAFNTRSSIYLMGVVLLIVLFSDVRGRGITRRQKRLIITFVIVALLLLVYLMKEYDFGNRLVEGISTSDDSSNTRFMLIGIILGLPLSQFLWGMNNGIEEIITKYDFFAIENSLANFIVSNGFVYTFLWCVLIYKCLKTINVDVHKFRYSFAIFFILLNANNSLMTDAPIVIIYILALYSINSVGQISIKERN